MELRRCQVKSQSRLVPSQDPLSMATGSRATRAGDTCSVERSAPALARRRKAGRKAPPEVVRVLRPPCGRGRFDLGYRCDSMANRGVGLLHRFRGGLLGRNRLGRRHHVVIIIFMLRVARALVTACSPPWRPLPHTMVPAELLRHGGVSICLSVPGPSPGAASTGGIGSPGSVGR